MKELGVAVVGLGAMGSQHARFFKNQVQGAKLVAVVDQVKAVAESVGAELGAESYTTIDQAVRDERVDVMCLATPTYLHVSQALYALEYGKHVLVEKPMATTLAGARQLISKAKSKHLKLGVDFMERYSDAATSLKSLIEKGDLGKLFLIEGELKWWRDEKSYYLKDELARSWRGMWETEGGGALTNQGIHTVDLMIYFGGDVQEVFGHIANFSHPAIPVEDTGVAALKFREGHLGTLSETVSTKPASAQYRKIRIMGTAGSAEMTDNKVTFLATETKSEIHLSSTTGETLKQSPNLYIRLLQDFIDSIIHEREFKVSGEEGAKALEVIKAVYLSSSTGQPVRLPISAEVVI